MANFINMYKISGFFYSLVTILINKGLFMIVLLYLFVIGIAYLKKHIMNIIGINKEYAAELVIPLIKKYIVISIILIIYDVILYVFGNMFLKYLTFML